MLSLPIILLTACLLRLPEELIARCIQRNSDITKMRATARWLSDLMAKHTKSWECRSSSDDNTMKALLRAFPRLTQLRLENRNIPITTTGLTDRGCRALGALSLEKLAFGGQTGVSENELVKTFSSLESLTSLEIRSGLLTDVGLVKITKSRRALRSLHLKSEVQP